jgi:hypothetical protein
VLRVVDLRVSQFAGKKKEKKKDEKQTPTKWRHTSGGKFSVEYQPMFHHISHQSIDCRQRKKAVRPGTGVDHGFGFV